MPESAFYGPIIALLVFGVIVVLVVALVRWLHRIRMAKIEARDPVLTKLKQQLADGEIDARQFEKTRRRLQK